MWVLFLPLLLQATKWKGVSLGGWLLVEPWITPSLFPPSLVTINVNDEYTLCQALGPGAKSHLTKHRETFINESHIKEIAATGLNAIKIPVGYWVIDELIEPHEPWVGGGLQYLKQAVSWATKYNLSVVIDMHGAPGSQNGLDRSGRRGAVDWDHAEPDGHGGVKFPNMAKTVDALVRLATLFQGTSVVGLTATNEPAVTFNIDQLKEFYNTSYQALSKVRNRPPALLIDDSARFRAWNGFMPSPRFENVYLDTQHYEVFDTYELSWDHAKHIDNVCKVVRSNLKATTLWATVGEWSVATTDCQQWLNGIGHGSRYDGTFGSGSAIGSCKDRSDASKWTPEERAFTKKWAEAQMAVYDETQGWFYWTAKTEGGFPEWDYLAGIKGGWIPTQFARNFTC